MQEFGIFQVKVAVDCVGVYPHSDLEVKKKRKFPLLIVRFWCWFYLKCPFFNHKNVLCTNYLYKTIVQLVFFELL